MRVFISVALITLIASVTPTYVTTSAETSVALVSKVILDVARKQSGKDWEVAKRGQTLSSGDRVRTGEKSTAVIKFKDNSLVRVREKSELSLIGLVSGSAFSKSVDLERGIIGFSIQKQQPLEEFRFTSPTSVASIRGTGGRFSSIDSTDTLTVVEGNILLTNRISLASVDVGAGFTGISSPDGRILARPSTPEERSAAESTSRETEHDNRLEFELRDSRGNKKNLRIEYK